METTTERPLRTPAPEAPAEPSRLHRVLVAVAGPALIVFFVLLALRGFVFLPRLSNGHPDILSFWLPRSCLMGRALSSGHVPLWNPFEMAGTPFAADPQSGWLYVPSMLTSWLFGCGNGLRAFIVLNPIVAGLGMWWFLRRERLGRIPATAGGLSLALVIAGSNLAISLPFAGTLAWTPLVLVGASGAFTSSGWRRLLWIALAAFAWGQVASAHLSHGLVLCTALVGTYVVARAIHEVRAGRISWRLAVALGAGLLLFLPLANLAIEIPRFALSGRSSLHAGYGALGATVPQVVRSAGPDRPIPDTGLWAAWPLAAASTPGAYVGATLLLAVVLAARDRARRWLVIGVAAAAVVTYLLTISVIVGYAPFRALVLHIPFGDVYLHNPTRLRYVVFLVAPILGAIGLGTLFDDPPPMRALVRWFAVGFVVFLLFPLVAGANVERLLVFAVAAGAVFFTWRALANRERWAKTAVVGVLLAELLVAVAWSTTYEGGRVYFGLEGADRPALVPGPLRFPNVALDEYLAPTPLTRTIGADPQARYLAWIPPAAFFNKGYLFTQGERDWPALLLGRAIVFGLHDTLGYSPIQLPRYWSYIRATNAIANGRELSRPLRVFYNAAVISEPEPEDIRLLGIRYLIVHEGQELPPGIEGRVVARDRGYLLLDLDIAEPRVSVVPSWREVESGQALGAVLADGFDPAFEAVVEDAPAIEPTPDATPGTATYAERDPEDVVIHATATAPSIVVVRNAWDRGWSATVDGRPESVVRTDGFLQGVPVGAGDHEIVLTYTDPTIGDGLLASGLVWLGWLVAFVVAVIVGRRRSRSERLEDEPAPAGSRSTRRSRSPRRRARRGGAARPRSAR
jgi:hypothetical protein